MCYHRSCVVHESGNIFVHPSSDHHTQIRREYKLPDATKHGDPGAYVNVETVPEGPLFDYRYWKVQVDHEIRPQWFDKHIEKSIMERMLSEFKRRANIDARVYAANHDLMFDTPTIPDESTIIARQGNLIIHGLRRPIRGVTLVADNIRLRTEYNWSDFRELFDGCRFIVKGGVDMEPSLAGFLRCSGQLIETYHRPPYDPLEARRQQQLRQADIMTAMMHNPHTYPPSSQLSGLI